VERLIIDSRRCQPDLIAIRFERRGAEKPMCRPNGCLKNQITVRRVVSWPGVGIRRRDAIGPACASKSGSPMLLPVQTDSAVVGGFASEMKLLFGALEEGEKGFLA